MIARFDGKCATCGCVLKKGDEIFYDKTEGAHCWPCRDNPQPSAAQYECAAALGFIPSADLGGDGWPSVCQDWVLRSLPQVDLRSPARGIGLQARGRNGDLFGE